MKESDLHCASDSHLLDLIPDDLTLSQFMLDSQTLRPDRGRVPCLVDDATGKTVDFEELRARTYGLANSLSSRYSIGQDDVVLIASPNHIDYPVAVLAVHRLGGVVTVANPNSTRDELLHQVTMTKSTFMIVHSMCLAAVLSAVKLTDMPADRIILIDQLPASPESPCMSLQQLVQLCGYRHDRSSHDRSFTEPIFRGGQGKRKVAILFMSSGTTGAPKAVKITHYGLIANVMQMKTQVYNDANHPSTAGRGLKPGDVTIGALPFYHAGGMLVGLLLALFCGMTMVVVEKYSFPEFLDTVVRRGITVLILVPPQAVTLCKHPAVKNYDLSRVKCVMVGAAPMTKEVNELLFRKFPKAHIGQVYGMTEATSTIAMLSLSQQRGTLGSGGHFLPGVQVRVVKADGTLARSGESGELYVKTPSVALGYLGDDQSTQETFVDGWLRTGDEGFLSGTGEVFITDRIKELIKVRAFQVAPAEIEGLLLSHPAVVDSCVVGIPHQYSGEVPRAYVVLSTAIRETIQRDPHALKKLEESILEHVAKDTISYKHLTGGVEFVPSIAKTPSGKILRRVLRDRARARLADVKVKL